MIQHPGTKSPKQLATILIVALAVALSWLRPIDDFTEEYLSDSIKTAAIIFGIARAINAAISVTQSAEVSVGVASVSPGEVLDPINDLIERFSEVMTISLTSLVFQRILLEVAAHWIFNVLVTLAAFAFLIALVFQRHQILTLKAFGILLVIRLFLSLVILANSAVDQVFLESQVASSKDEMELLKSNVGAAASAAAAEEGTQIDTVLKQYTQDRSQLHKQIEDLKSKIAALNAKKGKRPWWLPEAITRNPERKNTNAAIERLEDQIARARSQIEELDKKTEAVQEKRDCLNKQVRGEGCSWLESIKKSGDWLKVPTIDISDKVDSLVTLMALIVLRSIVLPLFFWVVIYKTIRWIWTGRTVLVRT